MTLYITEDCKTCSMLRESLDELALAYDVVVVLPDNGFDRLPEGTEAPVLVDDDRVIQGSRDIFAYLEDLEELKRVWLKYQSDICYSD